MRLTRDQVEQISQRIIRGLLKDELIATDHPEQVIDRMAALFTENLVAEDRLNDEVRTILMNYTEEISRGVNYQEVFRKIKAKLARDRKMVI